MPQQKILCTATKSPHKERRNKGDSKLNFLKEKKIRKNMHTKQYILKNTYTQDLEIFGRVEIFTQMQVFWKDVSTLCHDDMERLHT